MTDMIPALPRLLDSYGTGEIRRLNPLEMSLVEVLSGISYAQMTLSQAEGAGIEPGALIRLYTNQGDMGVYRVQAVTEDEDTTVLDLSHGLVTLTDTVIPPKETEEPEDSGGSGSGDDSGDSTESGGAGDTEGGETGGESGDTGDGTEENPEEKPEEKPTEPKGETVPLREAIQTLFNAQPVSWWTLGVVEVPDSSPVTWSYDYDTLWEKLTALMSNFPAYMLTFDMSSQPWVLNVVLAPTAADCELRYNRNLETASITYDRSELCTRLYVDGIKEPIDADTIGVWGVVSQAMTGDPDFDEAYWREEARLYLERYKNPALSVTIEAAELSHLTGEPLDRLVLGRMCRLALPDRGAVVNQRIVEMQWRDVYGDPERVRISMSNAVADTASILSAMRAEYRRKSKQSLTKLKDMYSSIEEIDGKLTAFVNEVSIELDAMNATIALKASQMALDELSARLTAAEIKIDGINATIDLSAIYKRLDDLEDFQSSASILIDGMNARIELKAEQSVVDELGERISKAEILIDGANAKIELKASREEVTALEERLSQAEIDIDGANARIDLKASQSTVDDLAERVSSAEVAIDGANARIDLKANSSTVNSLSNRVASAELLIDGMEGEISSKVSKNGEISAINQTSESVTISASKINLSGYVTATEFNALETTTNSLKATQSAWATTFNTNTLGATTAWITGLHAESAALTEATLTNVSIKGDAANWKEEIQVCTRSATYYSNTVDIVYYDPNSGTNKSLTVVTGISQAQSPTYRSITYLGKTALSD